MKITEKLHLRKSGGYFKLTELQMVEPKDPSKASYEREINVCNFSTVYQSLTHLIKTDYNIEEDLLSQFKELIKLIDEKSDLIKKEFRTEVLAVIGG